MPVPPQIAWMLGAATGCIVSTVGMNLVFRNPKTGVVRECSLEEITSLGKLDASEIDIAKLRKEVSTDALELYMRYQKEGAIEHFTDEGKKTISRIETMGISGAGFAVIHMLAASKDNRPRKQETIEKTNQEGERNRNESGSDVGNIAKKLDTNNIPNMTKQDIIDSIPDDWNYTEHNGFVHIRDADGYIRIRIDPPDKVTQYPHVHAYDSVGNLLDSAGNIVDRKSPDGHIPYKDN